MLARCSAAGLATTNDLGLTVHHLPKQVEVFVIDVHGPRPNSINKDWVFLLDLGLGLGSLAGCLRKPLLAGHWTHVCSLLLRLVLGFVSFLAQNLYFVQAKREEGISASWNQFASVASIATWNPSISPASTCQQKYLRAPISRSCQSSGRTENCTGLQKSAGTGSTNRSPSFSEWASCLPVLILTLPSANN